MAARRAYSKVAFDTNVFVKGVVQTGIEAEVAVRLAHLVTEAILPAVHEVSASSVTRADFERVRADAPPPRAY